MGVRRELPTVEAGQLPAGGEKLSMLAHGQKESGFHEVQVATIRMQPAQVRGRDEWKGGCTRERVSK